MKRKNCGKHVYEVPAPFCLNKLYRTKCPVDCRKAKQKPVINSLTPNRSLYSFLRQVCGSDGQLYASSCELQKMTCGFPLTRYERITEGNIDTVTDYCSPHNASSLEKVPGEDKDLQ